MCTISDAYDFIHKASYNNDPLEYVFGDLINTFSENETKVLAALSCFSGTAKPRWIAEMTELAEVLVKTALEDLSDRSILIASNEETHFYLPQLTATFIRKKRKEFVDQIEKRSSILVCQKFEKAEITDAISLWQSEAVFFETILSISLVEIIKQILEMAIQDTEKSKSVSDETINSLKSTDVLGYIYYLTSIHGDVRKRQNALLGVSIYKDFNSYFHSKSSNEERIIIIKNIKNWLSSRASN